MFFCQNCGNESSKWMGQCPVCHEWNTFVEESLDKKEMKSRKAVSEIKVYSLDEVEDKDSTRISTDMMELDRVLGGGIVPGSLILVGGDPGIGKSTLLLQVCKNVCKNGSKMLYISGEESLQQIKLRANRMGEFDSNLSLLCETSLNIVKGVIEKEKPDMVVIDSIQTMFDEDVSSAPGSVTQVRQATATFLQLAKGLGITIFIVGHVTKEGVVAGPRVLEHMVDTVLYFEGERHGTYRILRGVKNRFGSTNEIGVFEMTETGLLEVENPSQFMLEGKPKNASGSVVACAMEGTRPILLEVQALVCSSNFGNPRRTANGVDYNRVNLLMAVLEKRLGLHLSSYDAYVNITGGLRMNEPALDLAVVMALASSYKERPIEEGLICFGEVGLSGEVRSVSQAQQRVNEAKKLGFSTIVMPKSCLKNIKKDDEIKIIGVENVHDVYDLL